MHILIGAVMAAALLYFWLAGWWFAGLLVGLPLAIVSFFLGGALAGGGHPDPATTVPVGLLCAIIAAGIAAAPWYYRRWQWRQTDAGVKDALAVLGSKVPPLPH